MQAYLNGHQDRDLDLHEAAPDVAEHGQGPLPDVVDVLIVGTGPAGMLLAAQLSQFGGINTRILERRGQALELGHADGLHPRTLEMFRAFGIDHMVAREGYQANEFTFWGVGATGDDIVREGTTPDMPAGISEFPHIVLNQARVQDFLGERMAKSPRRLTPDYGHEVVHVERTADGEHVDVTVNVTASDGSVSTRNVRTRYLVGCDGARSKVRSSMGLELRGDSQNHAWGVVDALVDTNFPDIRKKSSIACEAGQVLIIPREGGYLVRLYVDMGEIGPGNEGMRDTTTVDDVIAVAQRVLSPYQLDVKHVQWWSVYAVGQRVTDRFDDAIDAAGNQRDPRIFIAGDACHTHSAKAGQGMNVSMADAFNLGWKLAAVLEGRSPAELLGSYTSERQPVAAELIEFDRFWARLASGIDEDGHVVTTAERQAHQARRRRFMAGVATHYEPSSIVGEGAQQALLAQGYPVGERFQSAPVMRLVDALPTQLGHVHLADGRWRVYLFGDAANPSSADSKLGALARWLSEDPASPVLCATTAGRDIDSAIDVRAVLQQSAEEVELFELPAILHPKKGVLGLPDLEKVFVRLTGEAEDIFAQRGIDRATGCAVIVRPDQFVAEVLPLDDHEGIAAFFSGCLTAQAREQSLSA